MGDALLSYPFKLPNRQYLCRLHLPSDLTQEEVNRLVAYLNTLVMPQDEESRAALKEDESATVKGAAPSREEEG